MKLYDANGKCYFEGNLEEYKYFLSTQKKGSSKTIVSEDTQKKEAKKYETRAEAINAWCEEKGYTAEQRKAYGEAKRAERALQKEAYEKTNACFTERVSKKEWRAKYNEILKSLKK